MLEGPSHLPSPRLCGQRVGHRGQSALTAVASTLLNAKAVRLEGASLTPKQVHAFCDHVELLIRARVYDLIRAPHLHVVGDRPAIHDLQRYTSTT